MCQAMNVTQPLRCSNAGDTTPLLPAGWLMHNIYAWYPACPSEHTSSTASTSKLPRGRLQRVLQPHNMLSIVLMYPALDPSNHSSCQTPLGWCKQPLYLPSGMHSAQAPGRLLVQKHLFKSPTTPTCPTHVQVGQHVITMAGHSYKFFLCLSHHCTAISPGYPQCLAQTDARDVATVHHQTEQHQGSTTGKPRLRCRPSTLALARIVDPHVECLDFNAAVKPYWISLPTQDCTTPHIMQGSGTLCACIYATKGCPDVPPPQVASLKTCTWCCFQNAKMHGVLP